MPVGGSLISLSLGALPQAAHPSEGVPAGKTGYPKGDIYPQEVLDKPSPPTTFLCWRPG